MKILKRIWKEKKKLRYFPKLILKFAKIKLAIEALCMGFEVLTALVMERTIFWDMNVVSSVDNQPTFRRNISPHSSVSKNKPSMKPARKQMARRLASLQGYMLLRNVG
jgi:hypothetical protein